jgi:periplasmic divalent cation tolerance protein
MSIRVILVTAPSESTGKELADLAVTSGLAACVSVIPGVTSVYYWKSEVQTDKEVQLLFKTNSDKAPMLIKMLKENHPYDCPECIVLHADEVEKGYATWIHETVNRSGTNL